MLEQFQILGHTQIFQIQEWFLYKFSKSVTCLTIGWCGCSPNNIASWTWQTTWECHGHGLNDLDRQFHVHALCTCRRVALATWAELLELPTFGMPVASCYHRIWLGCHFRGELRIDFAAGLQFWILIFCVRTALEISFWGKELIEYSCSWIFAHKGSSWTRQH